MFQLFEVCKHSYYFLFQNKKPKFIVAISEYSGDIINEQAAPKIFFLLWKDRMAKKGTKIESKDGANTLALFRFLKHVCIIDYN